MNFSPADAHQDHVLIVAKAGDAMRMKSQLLESGHASVSICANVQQAIENSGLVAPDIVLIDLDCAGCVDGLELAAMIFERWQAPVVFLTDRATQTRTPSEPLPLLDKSSSASEINATLAMVLARHQNARALAEAEARHNLILGATGMAEWSYVNGRLFSDARFHALLGFPEAFLNQDWTQFLIRVVAKDRPKLESALSESFCKGLDLHQEFRFHCGDGAIRWFEAHARIHGPRQRKSLIGVLCDTTLRHAQETHLKDAAAVLAAAGEAISVTDDHGLFLSINPAFEVLTGYSEKEIVGTLWNRIHRRQTSEPSWEEIMSALNRDSRWQGETILKLKNGGQLTVWQIVTAVPDAGRIRHYVSIFTDLAALHRAEDRLAFLAHHDPLTGLPNRLLLQDRLAHAFARRDYQCAIIFLDLDNFKLVNDTLGHSAGDQLLQTVARRIPKVLRQCDTVARFGGDEFVILIENAMQRRSLLRVCDSIQKALRAPLTVFGQHFEIGASLGVAMAPTHARNPHHLLQAADTALYNAKAAGKSQVCFYEREMTRELSKLLRLKNEMRRAFERGEFKLHYQPQITPTDSRIIGFEALLRWNHPELGLLRPNTFIKIAEQDDFIQALGNWVFVEAVRQAQIWADQGDLVRVAVNCSVRELVAPGYVNCLKKALANSHLAPEHMELEITESSLHDLSVSGTLLQPLRDLGVGIAIDDFGIGYSSLAALRHLPINRLKVDQSFLHGIPEDIAARHLFEGIIKLGHSLDLKVLGEGVESAEQLEFLRETACCEAQGYYIARPMDADAACAYLVNHRHTIA